MELYRISFPTNGFTLAPGEHLLQCPYSRAHQITNKRMLNHLTKCRKSYMDEHKMTNENCDVVICRWNSLHHLARSEARAHESNCPYAIDAIRLFQTSNSVKQPEPEEKIEPPAKKRKSKKNKTGTAETPIVLDEEDWEAESEGYKASYDPSVKLKSQPVFYIPGGLKPAEKRKYRQQQVEFFAEFHKTKEEPSKIKKDDVKVKKEETVVKVEVNKEKDKESWDNEEEKEENWDEEDYDEEYNEEDEAYDEGQEEESWDDSLIIK